MKRRMWVSLILIFAALIGGRSLRAQQGAAPASNGSFLSASAAFIGQTVQIPMRDERAIAADIYIPKTGGKYPVVLIQTPYNKNLMRGGFAGQGRYGSQSLFTDSSYAFVVTDWRGKFASQDAQPAGTQPNLGADGFDAIAWIVKQEWSNGKVATWGPSALGRVQYETARSNPPNLVCAVPMVMALNLDYDSYFPGGVIWQEFVTRLGQIGFGTSIFDQLAARPINDDSWQKTQAATFIKGEDLRIPMLFIGGWYDIYTDKVMEAFQTARTAGGEKARAHSRLIMGPWIHGTDQVRNGQLDYANAQSYGMKKAMAFIDYWVKDAPNGFDKQEPRISYFQMGTNEWRSTESWPPPGSRERAYYLHPDRSLSTKAPASADGSAAAFDFDPSNPVPTVGGHLLDVAFNPGPMDQHEKVESRSDVLVFSTPVLEKDAVVAGKVRVKLFVSSDRPDTDFTAILTDVYPDGRSMLVTEGIRRMRFRNTTSKEELMTPGTIYPVTIELTNTALTFLKGHKVRVIVSSSNYPRFALNLNDGGRMYQKGKGLIARNSIYADKTHPSALVLPMVGN
jgi:uncharacterized protein